MSRKKVYYINFITKPYSVEIGHLKILDNVLEDIELKNEKIIKLESKGEIVSVEAKNIYLKQKDAEDRFKEYTALKKFKEDNKLNNRHICYYCKKIIYNYKDVTIDHIIPKSKGGKTETSNLCVACRECNQEKDSKHANVFSKNLNIKMKTQFRKQNIGFKSCKIARSIDLKRNNKEVIAKSDSREWDIKMFDRVGNHFGNKVDRILMNIDKYYISFT